jgi:hypothetical protein
MIYTSGVLIRRGGQLVYLQNSSETGLLRVEMTPDRCLLRTNGYSKTWISAGYFAEAGQHGIELQEGSKLRLGPNLLTVQAAIPSHIDVSTSYEANIDPDNYCRYCYESSDSELNPLFRPCTCTDGIHLRCFLEFIRKKFEWDYWRVGRQWRPAQCEICHSDLPLVFKHQDRNYFFCTDTDFVPPLLMLTQDETISSLPFCFLFKNKRRLDLFSTDASLEYRNDKFFLRCNTREAPVFLEAPEEVLMEQDMCLQVEDFQLKFMLRHTVKVKVVGPELVRMVQFGGQSLGLVDCPPD